jgi:hypothetical protein
MIKGRKELFRQRLSNQVQDFLKRGGKITKFNSGGYSLNTDGNYLHREVYEQYYGSIPKGYEVHHIDGNQGNNDPKNLSALRKSIHAWIHKYGGKYVTEGLSKEEVEKLNTLKKLPNYRPDEDEAYPGGEFRLMLDSFLRHDIEMELAD